MWLGKRPRKFVLRVDRMVNDLEHVERLIDSSEGCCPYYYPEQNDWPIRCRCENARELVSLAYAGIDQARDDLPQLAFRVRKIRRWSEDGSGRTWSGSQLGSCLKVRVLLASGAHPSEVTGEPGCQAPSRRERDAEMAIATSW